MGDLIVSRQSMMTPEAMMPAMALSAAKERHDAMIRFVAEAMERDRDYGVIPGTNQKPTLLKPGAEKLKTFFGLTNRFPLVAKTEDWMGIDHGGEPFFYYWYNCQLWRGDYLIAEAEGSANSWEKKYRYRQSERVCPLCGQTAIIKGKTEYGGGWLCWAKKGGCGAKFADGDAAIEGQEVGRIPNPDVFDQVNTIQKMAQKRALIAAVLIGVNASEFFTQDLEDFEDGSGEPPTTTKREMLRRSADRATEPEPTLQEQRDNAPPKPNEPRGLYKPESTRSAQQPKRREAGTPEQVKSWLAQKAQVYAAQGGTVSDGQRGAMVGALEALFPSETPDMAKQCRYSLLKYIFATETSKTLTPSQVKALLAWSQTQDGQGSFVPDPVATTEANRIINMLTEEAGQTKMADLEREIEEPPVEELSF